ncbi:fimbrial biogenesis usher protein, partial [Klebsiella aerogenes]
VGRLSPLFGGKGQLCVTEAFLQGAGLVVPGGVARLARQEEDASDSEGVGDDGATTPRACYDYQQDYPTAVITPLPGEEALSLTVPPAAVEAESAGGPATNYRTGGTAGLLNYQTFTTRTTFGDADDMTYSQVMLEEGINVHDWLLRSRQSLSWNDGQYDSDNLYTYAQRTIVPLKKQFQAGQINTAGSLLSGVSITGVQLTPEDALMPDVGSGVQVSGVARGAQARVDVRQRGQVVYSTLVPAGPFTLTDVPVTSTNNDLDVTVTETDGSQGHFVIPASALSSGRLSSPQGLSVAVGRYRDESGEDTEEPWLATLSDGWHLRPWLNTGVGMMLAQRYSALVVSLDALPLSTLLVSGTVKASDDQRGDHRGHSGTFSVGYSVGQSFGINASATHYSDGYRDLQDTLADDFIQYNGQYTASLRWNHPAMGAFSLGYTLSQGTQSSEDSRYVNASWGRTFGRANVSVTWQTQVGQDAHKHDDSCCSRTNDGNLLFVNVSIPVGGQNVSLYSRTRDHDTTAGAQVSGNLTENSHYSISAERDTGDREDNFSGTLNSNLHYAQLGLNAGTQGSNSKNYGATLSGGVVAHGGGVTFSPWAVDDTFAIVDSGREASGVQISTPSGPVWTDWKGEAVVPSVSAYRTTRVEMDTTSLPENVDVDNGFSQLAAGRGSVSKINFHVLSVRRVMMQVRLANGGRLKKGASVVDREGNYIGTVVEDGLLFLEDAVGSPALYVTDEQGQHLCRIHYTLPDDEGKIMVYEQINGVCR